MILFSNDLTLEEVTAAILQVEYVLAFASDCKYVLQRMLETLRGIKKDLEKQEHDRALAVLGSIRNVLSHGPDRAPAK